LLHGGERTRRGRENRLLCVREFIDYKTSMITDKDPLRELLFY